MYALRDGKMRLHARGEIESQLDECVYRDISLLCRYLFSDILCNISSHTLTPMMEDRARSVCTEILCNISSHTLTPMMEDSVPPGAPTVERPGPAFPALCIPTQ